MTRTLGMFPLSTVLFPGAELPLHVFEERYRRLMADCLGGDAEFGVVLITRGSEVGGGDERVDVGTVARISQVAELDGGRMLVVVHGVSRVLVHRWLPDSPYPRAVVGDLPVERSDGDGGDTTTTTTTTTGPTPTAAAEVAVRRVRSLLSELGDVPALPHDLDLSAHDEQIGWQLCELAPLNLIDRQRLLACSGLGTRMELLSSLCTDMVDDVVSLLAEGSGS